MLAHLTLAEEAAVDYVHGTTGLLHGAGPRRPAPARARRAGAAGLRPLRDPRGVRGPGADHARRLGGGGPRRDRPRPPQRRRLLARHGSPVRRDRRADPRHRGEAARRARRTGAASSRSAPRAARASSRSWSGGRELLARPHAGAARPRRAHARVRARRRPPRRRPPRPGAGVPVGDPRAGGARGLLQPALLPRPDRRPDGPLAPPVHGGAVLGLRGDRAEHRHAGARAQRDRPGGDARPAAPLGPRVLRRAGRAEARRARHLRARGRVGRAQPAHHRAPRRRRLDHRRAQDLDRQRRDRRRPRRQRDRRPGAGPPRAGAVHRAARHARPAARAQARQARLPRVAHGRAALRRLPRTRRAPAGGRRAARAPPGQRARGRERLRDARRVRADAPDGRGAGARHRPRRARVRLRLGVAARGVRRPHPRQAGHLVPARRPGGGPRRGAAADLAGLVDGGAGHPLPPRRGLDGQAQGLRGRGPHHRAGDPGRRRLGLRQRPPGRRSGTATPSSTRSSRARARSSGS